MVFRLCFAGLLTRSQGMSPSHPPLAAGQWHAGVLDTPFGRNSQQRDCPGFSPDSLFIRRPGRTDAEQNAAKVRLFGEWCKGRGGFLRGGHPTCRVFRRGLRGFHGLSFIIKPDFIDYITRCMTTICTLSVSPLCGFAGRYLRFCPQISPSLSADIPALARRYLRPGPEISPLVGFHAPINSANGYYIEYVKSA